MKAVEENKHARNEGMETKVNEIARHVFFLPLHQQVCLLIFLLHFLLSCATSRRIHRALRKRVQIVVQGSLVPIILLFDGGSDIVKLLFTISDTCEI